MKKLIFDGHLAKDAEVKETSKGRKYVNFRVGCTTFIKGENKTDWIDVASFNLNDVEGKAQYLTKGRHVQVIGTVDTMLNTSKDGRIFINHSVLADSIDFISSGQKNNENNSNSEKEPSIAVAPAEPAVKPVAKAEDVSIPVMESASMDNEEPEDDLPF